MGFKWNDLKFCSQLYAPTVNLPTSFCSSCSSVQLWLETWWSYFNTSQSTLRPSSAWHLPHLFLAVGASRPRESCSTYGGHGAQLRAKACWDPTPFISQLQGWASTNWVSCVCMCVRMHVCFSPGPLKHGTLVEPEMIGCGKAREGDRACVAGPSEGAQIKSCPVQSVIGSGSPNRSLENCCGSRINSQLMLLLKNKNLIYQREDFWVFFF